MTARAEEVPATKPIRTLPLAVLEAMDAAKQSNEKFHQGRDEMFRERNAQVKPKGGLGSIAASIIGLVSSWM